MDFKAKLIFILQFPNFPNKHNIYIFINNGWKIMRKVIFFIFLGFSSITKIRNANVAAETVNVGDDFNWNV